MPPHPVRGWGGSAYTCFVEWATDRGISLYPAQDEAVTELVSGANVILSTPPGRGSRSSPSRRTRRASTCCRLAVVSRRATNELSGS